MTRIYVCFGLSAVCLRTPALAVPPLAGLRPRQSYGRLLTGGLLAAGSERWLYGRSAAALAVGVLCGAAVLAMSSAASRASARRRPLRASPTNSGAAGRLHGSGMAVCTG